MVDLFYKIISSPIGKLQLVASNAGLRSVCLSLRGAESDVAIQKNDQHILLKTEKQLAEYFAGERKVFDIKLEMCGTVFQINAWRELLKIPFGETISYGEQAARLGDAKKSRAVGAANGRNPLMIIVPCHRVIGANGGLTGYASGLEIKEFLLDLEKSCV